MNEILGIASVAPVTIVCFLIGIAIKATEKIDKYIPTICGLVGLALGLLWYFCGWPGLMAQEPVTAAAIGIVSGLAATGLHQVYKQLTEG